MTKIIYSRMIYDVCKIIIDDAKMADIMEARKFITQGRWKGTLKIPLNVIVYGCSNDDKWDSYADVHDDGKVDLVHDWYDGAESFINFDNLLDIKEDIYVSDRLLDFAVVYDKENSHSVDMEAFYKNAEKEDIKIINKAIVLRKLAGEE